MKKQKNIFADLHTHSTASDGLLTPTQLIESACEKGLSVIGITDHDTVAGLAEARRSAVRSGIRLVEGIELSCGWKGRDTSVHVLGLYIDENATALQKLLNEQREQRFQRALKMVDLLAGLGLDVAELRQRFEQTPEKVLGRPHIARYLQERGYVKDFQGAFEKYLSRGKPAYVAKDHVLPEVGIDVIHAAGGIAVVAHPGLTSDWTEVWSHISGLRWDGIETYYSEHTPSDVKRFAELAGKYNLVSTGGSDYHGEYGKHTNRLGNYGLTQELYFDLVSKCAAKGINIV
ncbi:MAG: phosphatase [Candidatus Riflebacteria bacterium HGW-Riflebacteria-2]|nr:MAG: phosphatase [Candidatus Riflebacteria bacterium HGW-Riflebacteria-2]